MMHKAWRGLVAPLLVLSAGVACDDGAASTETKTQDTQTTTSTTAPTGGSGTGFVRAPYRVVLSGAEQLSFDAVTDLRMLKITQATTAQSDVELLSVGAAQPVPSGGRVLRVGMDLMKFRGNGAYTIGVSGPSGGPADRSNLSNVRVEVWPGTDVNANPAVYTRILEPCQVAVRNGGDGGSVTCPRIAGPKGEIAVEMSWGAP